jgi:anti-sigma regulatory factor (Ser/Thr protein kinase)
MTIDVAGSLGPSREVGLPRDPATKGRLMLPGMSRLTDASLAAAHGDDTRQGEPAGPGGVPPILDLAFDSDTLHALRAEVRSYARGAGLPDGRAGDVVLAVHELAANAVRYGAGSGRLRIWNLAGTLHCQVDDGGPLASSDPAGPRARSAGSEAAEMGSASGRAVMNSRRPTPGHGLWVARQVADQMQVLSDPDGTRARVTFDLPS